jgi:rhamnogalacturonyl hydrolase YesR
MKSGGGIRAGFVGRVAVAALALMAAASALAASKTVKPDALRDWPAGAAPREVGERVAKRFLASSHLINPQFSAIHYAEVGTWYGALTFAQRSGNKTLRAQLIERFEPFFGAERALVPPANHVDNSVFGTLPLEIYLQTHRAKYRTMGLAMADEQWANPLPSGLSKQTRFWIDDMFMITAVQTQAWRATNDRRYLDRAASSMVAYLERLQQPNGLFFHAPDSPFFWGRGNGWMAAGMAMLLSSLPESHPQRPAILQAYRKMMATLLLHQGADGMWRQLIDQPSAWPESSSTGMFAFAFVTGVKHGWLDAATYTPAARRAWIALVGYLNENGEVREVCVGTGAGHDMQYYLDRPRSVGDLHGQAPILWTASALLGTR